MQIRLGQVSTATASLAVAMVVIACSFGGAPKIPEVAGVYEGEIEVQTEDAGVSVTENATAVVSQDGENIQISITVTYGDGYESPERPWEGTIDHNGEFSPDESWTAIDIFYPSGCGDQERESIRGSFADGELRLSTTATAACGTVTATLVAQKVVVGGP